MVAVLVLLHVFMFRIIKFQYLASDLNTIQAHWPQHSYNKFDIQQDYNMVITQSILTQGWHSKVATRITHSKAWHTATTSQKSITRCYNRGASSMSWTHPKMPAPSKHSIALSAMDLAAVRCCKEANRWGWSIGWELFKKSEKKPDKKTFGAKQIHAHSPTPFSYFTENLEMGERTLTLAGTSARTSVR